MTPLPFSPYVTPVLGRFRVSCSAFVEVQGSRLGLGGTDLERGLLVWIGRVGRVYFRPGPIAIRDLCSFYLNFDLKTYRKKPCLKVVRWGCHRDRSVVPAQPDRSVDGGATVDDCAVLVQNDFVRVAPSVGPGWYGASRMLPGSIGSV